jgi:hypothetical protein
VLRAGTNGARGLLFCAAKRSGAFPPNIPAGMRASVSLPGGFTRLLSGLLGFPRWGPGSPSSRVKRLPADPYRPLFGWGGDLHSEMMNTASKLGPHTQTDRGTCPGVGQVKLILSLKQRAKPAASRTRTCTNSAVCLASGECPSRF